MKELIRSLKLTKENTLTEIEEKLYDIPDFSSNYYLIKKMNCNGYWEAAEKIYEYLQNV